MSEESVLERVRRATRPCHDALERDLDVFARLATSRSRAALMQAYYAMYAPAEALLTPHLKDMAGLGFDERRKTAMLLGDLRTLGVAAPAHDASHLPAIANSAHALGFAYVLEGASLGGRVIRKRAGRALDGLRFFDGYGENTAHKWKEFCAVLERECGARAQAAVDGALAGFRYARRTLLDPEHAFRA